MPFPNEDTTPPVMNTNFVMNELAASKKQEWRHSIGCLPVLGVYCRGFSCLFQ